MPLRTRIKRALTRGSQDDGNGLSKTSSKSSKKDPRYKDPNVYQPGEKMPPLKYRRPVAPEHKEKLEAFNWAKAWRRRSDHSVYSPMGSRMPSRKTSRTTLGRKSIGGRSIGGRSLGDRRSISRSRGHDEAGIDSAFGGSLIGDADRHDRVSEGSDEEGDVTNVGLSRHATIDPRKSSNSAPARSQSIKSGSSRPATSDHARRSGSTRNDQPFTQEELELALQRSHLDPTKEESDRSGDRTPGSPGAGQKKVETDQIMAEGRDSGVA